MSMTPAMKDALVGAVGAAGTESALLPADTHWRTARALSRRGLATPRVGSHAPRLTSAGWTVGVQLAERRAAL